MFFNQTFLAWRLKFQCFLATDQAIGAFQVPCIYLLLNF